MFAELTARFSPACIESLEPRRLLSATHASPPDLTGATFNGTFSASNGSSGTVSITISTESKTGAVHGTLTETSTISGTASLTGSVNAKGKINLHAKGSNFNLNLTGTGTTSSISGRFTFAARHAAAHGTFETSR